MIKPNDEVGAIQSIEGQTVFMYGYGTYIGQISQKNMNVSKPNILLDNGKNLFGIECIWGSKEEIEVLVSNKEIVIIDPDDVRKTLNIIPPKTITS